MKKENILVKIWKILYTPLMYTALQLIITFVGFFAYGVYWGVRARLEGNIGISGIEQEISNFILHNTLLLQFISACICLLIVSFIWSKQKKRFGEQTKKMKVGDMLIIAGIGMCAFVIMEIPLLFLDLEKYFPSYEAMNEIIRVGGLVLQIAYIAIMGPIVEEIIFRGIIFNRLKKYNMRLWLAIFVQAVIFGIAHFNFLQSIFTIFCGILFAVIYQKAKTLWAPIIVHMFYNLTGVILIQFEEIAVPEIFLYTTIILSIMLGVGLFYLFHKRNIIVEETLEENMT